MRGYKKRLDAALVAFVSLCAVTTSLRAQADEPAMAHTHMSFTPGRPGTAADSARALDVVKRLRAAIAPYQTLEAAEAAGYRSRKEPEMVKGARLLHVGKRPGRRGEAKPFDPAAPQALLYRRDADGRLRLAGAMYVAAPSATLDDLDAMIPLSVAHWHRHLNVCVSGNRRSFRRIPQATTAEACESAGGRFRAESRYMVHVMTDAGTDLAQVFPQGRDEMGAMEMGPGQEH
jgi:hypothetical protein